MSCIIETSTTDDQIRCEFILQAPREKVWAALTTREGWSGWFSQDVESDFQVGSILKMDFGKYGDCWGVVSEREELKAFAYRWHPGDGGPLEKFPEGEMTTVRFEIEETMGKTKVVMTEFGFRAIPEARRIKALGDNTGGWAEELQEMIVWVDEGKPQAVSVKA